MLFSSPLCADSASVPLPCGSEQQQDPPVGAGGDAGPAAGGWGHSEAPQAGGYLQGVRLQQGSHYSFTICCTSLDRAGK